jgi:hypothetical protein
MIYQQHYGLKLKKTWVIFLLKTTAVCAGVWCVYVFRRNEKKKLKTEGMQVDLMFDFN